MLTLGVGAAAALLAALVGCGLIGRDDTPPERPCGPAGPWRPAGEIEICLGSVRAVPSNPLAPAAGGLCVADEAEACASDGDCGPAERCLCGLCRVPRCTSSSGCADGRSCIVALGRCAPRCDPAAPEPCPAGFSCSLGGCVADCGSDADCAHGETCNERSGRCATVPCAGDGDCEAGRRCELQTAAVDVLHPDAFTSGGEVRVLAEVARGGRSTVRGFSWPSLLRLESEGAELEPQEEWEGGRVGAPDAIEVDGAVLVFYAGGDDDGIGRVRMDGSGSFVRDAAGPILVPEAGWEAGRVGSPGAADDGVGGLLLFYTGGDAAGVGLARGATDGTFTRTLDGPVLAPADAVVADRWIDLRHLADPDVAGRSDDGRLRVYFAGLGVDRPGVDGSDGGTGNWSIGLALVDPSARAAAVTFDPWGPVLAARTGLGEGSVRDEWGPSVERWGDGWRMVWWEPAEGGGTVVRAAACP